MEVSDIIVSRESSILKTMQLFNHTGKQIALIAPMNKLEAVVTDGDIRRHIVDGGSLEEPVEKIANFNPRFIYEREKENAKKVMQKHSISALPILNDDGILTAIIFANDEELILGKKVGIPVVVMAGGLGTRLYPYTKILPKPLIPIGDIPIAEHIINKFHRYQCKDFYFILNHKRNMIKSYFNDLDRDYNIHYIDEEIPLGTGGGLSLLKGKLDSSFFLTNCDVIVEADYKDIYEYHKQKQNVITMVCAFKHVTIPYGVIELDDKGAIQSMSEKPQFSFLTNTGMYLVEPKIIEEMKAGEAIGFPDIIERYRRAGRNIGVYPVNEKCWLDMGQMEELEEMRKRLGV